jgi:malonyl-CoA decarboxylase
MSQAASTHNPLSAFERLRHWWQRLAAVVLPGTGAGEADRATERVLAEVRPILQDSRALRGGEVAAHSRAERIAAIYRGASLPQRTAILDLITHEFAPNREELERAIVAIQSAVNDAELSRAEARLRVALNAPRAKFFTQFNLLPEGVKFLVDLRADLLAVLPKAPALEVLKVELDGLLESWFDPGFLELRRITWHSPALILEKLIAYEAVHPIQSWNDLRNRLDTDRRCYAFFHPRLPNEPLIFVEIALTRGLPGSVQLLLDQNAPVQDPRTADTAVFYSISNTQKGLRGVSLGNLLLKRVIEDLRHDLPRLGVFATLSPLPGFRKWLDQASAENRALLKNADPSKLDESLREPMEKLAARYLMREKSGTHPLDPVAHFHLSNGAQVSRLYWLADTSAHGMEQSYGMMVSYRYEPSEVEENHERFLRDGHISAARRVSRLLD